MRDYSEITDEDIAIIAQGGDEPAAEYLLRKYKNMVNLLSRRFYIAGAEQEDVVQEGMIGLYKAILKYQSAKFKFSTFAYQCIRSSILDALRASLRGKHQPLNNYTSISDMEELYTDEENSPEQIILREEQIEIIWKTAKEILSEKEYVVFKLYIDGLTITEIAEAAGISYKSCDNTLQRVRSKIRRMDN